ncbi:hypothetical protein Tco_0974454 [Tanacetum coccineum]|uniref:Uncharacterized protein n=1 Tax=Tanacetum coccineum TaxID=301880 RepID=A0ABQ5ECS4_9ASTR
MLVNNNKYGDDYGLHLSSLRLQYTLDGDVVFRFIHASVLITEVFIQSDNNDKSESESCKSPTPVLFNDDARRISIRHCEILKSITLNVLARSQG